MANNTPSVANRISGFTLLETLVALGIATLLIATLIPISRNTLFRIATLSEQASSLAVIERVTDGSSSADDKMQNGITVRITKSALPQFSYPRDQREQWQPVLFSVETRGQWGSVTRTEFIKLEQVAP